MLSGEHSEALVDGYRKLRRDVCTRSMTILLTFVPSSSPSTPTKGYSSPIVGLRKRLDLYANVRPVKSVVPTAAFPDPIDLVIVRENTEDLYVKEEKTYDGPNGKIAEAIKRISENASYRIANMAGEIAARRQRVRDSTGSDASKSAVVTITHKSNVL